VNARSVYSKNTNIKQIFLAIEDVTEKG
jgi:hypothetical protein